MEPTILNITLILAALLAISEALALIPKVKSNSIFQSIWNTLKMLNPTGG